MKKLLLLLLLPLTLLGQDAYLSHSYIDNDANGFVVGDTITVKYELVNNGNKTPDFITFDFEYNNKLLELVSYEHDPTSNFATDIQKSYTHWVGYQFKPLTSYAGVAQQESDLDFQYYYGWQTRSSVSGDSNSYPTDSDWNVVRLSYQGSSDLPFSTPFIYVKFKIKDRQGTDYSNYNNVTNLNWANVQDIANSSGYLDINAGTEKISLSNVSGVNAGNITINLNSEAKADYATDFNYAIYAADGVNGKKGDAIETGAFDSNGQIITDKLIIDEKYYIEIKVNDQATWLDDVLTITDAFIIFKQGNATGTGGPGDNSNQNTFDYPIQYLLGELNNSGNITPDDAYQALAHVQGVEGLSEYFTSNTNGSQNVWGRIEQLGVSTDDYYFGQKFIIEPTDDDKTFSFGHSFIGDVDFSHGYTPTAEGSAYSAAQQNGFEARTSITTNALRDPVTSNIDLTSELIEGQVVFSINLAEEGVVGAQFNINYDNSILVLDNVIFDTGNELTNFANHKENVAKVNIGSLDQTGENAIKTGVAYKLIFTPNEDIQNTSGLITFKLTEGIKGDGTKVKFIIQ